MKLIDKDVNGSRTAEYYKHNNGTFEVWPVIGDNVSRAFPFKTFKTLKGAYRYGDKFLAA